MCDQISKENISLFSNLPELAYLLSLSEHTIYSYVFKQKIPSYKYPEGTQLYFILDEVKECLFGKENNSYLIPLIERNTTMKNKTQTLIDTKELADLLKIKISTVYSWTHKKLIPSYKQPSSKKIYFIKEEIIEKILQNRSSTKDELEIKAQTMLMKKKMIA